MCSNVPDLHQMALYIRLQLIDGLLLQHLKLSLFVSIMPVDFKAENSDIVVSQKCMNGIYKSNCLHRESE